MENVATSNVFRVLSIDGGGIKGVLPAAFLAELEHITRKMLCRHFDLIVGTSTGGIIALALGLGLPASTILDFYKSKGELIFPHATGLKRFLARFFRAGYDASALRSALVEVFGERKLADAKTRLVIPALSAATGDVYLFKTAHDLRFRVDYHEQVVDVALATSAAPTFFPTHSTPKGVGVIDGGMWANNPVLVAVVEALSYLRRDPGQVRVLSVGCSSTPMRVTEKQRVGGAAAWALSAIEWLMHGQSVSAVNQAALLIGKENVIRVQHLAPPGVFELDNFAAAIELEGVGREKVRSVADLLIRVFFQSEVDKYEPFYSE